MYLSNISLYFQYGVVNLQYVFIPMNTMICRPPSFLWNVWGTECVKLKSWFPSVFIVLNIEFMVHVLVWDQARLGRYNFLWWDITSLQPYTAETQFETSLLVQKSGGLALSSLSNVFHSLTTNARNIFIIMVRYQLKNHNDPTYLGEYVACNHIPAGWVWVPWYCDLEWAYCTMLSGKVLVWMDLEISRCSRSEGTVPNNECSVRK